MQRRGQLFPYALIFPLVGIILFVFVYPLGTAIRLSFFDNRGAFVGLENYQTLWGDGKFWHSLLLTVRYTVIYGAGIFAVGFATALFADVKWRGARVMAILLTLPYAVPDVAATLIWKWMLDPQYGIVNYAAMSLGLADFPMGWLTNPSLALYTVSAVSVWRLFPLHTLVILAGLRSVPAELYEAADMDGAGWLRKFSSITLPWLRNILSVLVLLTVIWSFQRFTILYLMTGGGPGRATETVVIGVYRTAFDYLNKSYAYAMGSVVLLILLVLTGMYFFIMRKSEE
ncbi:sugar ABC transporter permease [Limnochorda pilosa]|uniref:Sugar ABC transporter permease n=1 Tax=Limnochorda pilosa TaxID=1555112 RepID=A0A0K2SL72_LIMPI|nr:sugar ABC transporter permease [Limnochorda pilosa]